MKAGVPFAADDDPLTVSAFQPSTSISTVGMVAVNSTVDVNCEFVLVTAALRPARVKPVFPLIAPLKILIALTCPSGTGPSAGIAAAVA